MPMAGRWLAHYYGKVFIINCDKSNACCNTIRNNMDSLFPSDRHHTEEWAERFSNSFETYVVSPYEMAGPYTMRHAEHLLRKPSLFLGEVFSISADLIQDLECVLFKFYDEGCGLCEETHLSFSRGKWNFAAMVLLFLFSQ